MLLTSAPLVLVFLLLSAEGGPVTRKDYDGATKVLSQSPADLTPDAFLDAFRTVLRMDDARALRTAVAAYSRYAPAVQKKLPLRDFMTLHGRAASAFAVTRSPESVAELHRLLSKAKDWQARLLLLDASAFAKPVNLLDSCLAALEDDSPYVVRQSLRYLRRARKTAVVDLMIARWLEIATSKLKGPERTQWERTGLAFQGALHQLLKVDLSGPEDYRNYFEVRRNAPDLFDPKEVHQGGASRVTLFGAAVTGKNIAFVLDVSGSMTSRDPLPPGAEDDSGRGRTVVGDPAKDDGPRLPPIERERMYRAKKELSNVVRALPEDVRFNLVTYSSEVSTWKKSMVLASEANKKSALAYIAALEPEGLTFTDDAVETAFADLDIDTLYLVTDGAPTHVGNSGPQKPRDSDEIIRQIHDRVKELNFLRDVRIFTLGFEGAEEDFLKKLSADHMGQYVRIR